MREPAVRTSVEQHAGQGILEIVLNRPDAHNAVNGEAAELLASAWKRFRDDDALAVAILRGEGSDAFCAGADLKGLAGLATLDDASSSPDVHRQGPMGGTRIVQTKPVITTSQGYTYAGGLELYCHGHIRLAEPAATFSVACRRWGVPLLDGGTVYLPRLLGWGSALPLIITGQRISADRAYQLGLVWELVGKGEGAARARRIAEQLCELPQDCLRADLASAIETWHLAMAPAFEREQQNTQPVMQSESTRRGVDSFIQGRRFWFE
jgi:enoyl-CoA hydratase